MKEEIRNLPDREVATNGYVYLPLNSSTTESDEYISFIDLLNVPFEPRTDSGVSTIYKLAVSGSSAVRLHKRDVFNISLNETLIKEGSHGILLVMFDPTNRIDKLKARVRCNGITREVVFIKRDLDYSSDIVYMEMCFRESPSKTYRTSSLQRPLSLQIEFFDNPDLLLGYLGLVVCKQTSRSVRDSKVVGFKDVVYFYNHPEEGVTEKLQKKFLRI